MFHEAIYELYSDATSITGNDLGDIVVLDANGDEITIDASDVNAKVLELQEATEYQMARALAYPQIAEQLDKLFHDIDDGLLGEDAKTGSLYLALKEVKDDNPKPGE